MRRLEIGGLWFPDGKLCLPVDSQTNTQCTPAGKEREKSRDWRCINGQHRESCQTRGTEVLQRIDGSLQIMNGRQTSYNTRMALWKKVMRAAVAIWLRIPVY
jgi:hypothetical protein